jgi:hypothetical protein
MASSTQAAAGMTGGEVLGGEPPQVRGDQRQGVAQREQQRRARGRGEPQAAGLADAAGRHDHRGRAAERAVGPGGEGHDRHQPGDHVRQEPGDLLGLARLRQREHDVVAAERAEVAVHRFGRVEEVAGRAGGGERGRDLPGHEAGLADAGHDHASGAALDESHRAAEGMVEAVRRREHGLTLGPQNLAAAFKDRVVVGRCLSVVHAVACLLPAAAGRTAGAGL